MFFQSRNGYQAFIETFHLENFFFPQLTLLSINVDTIHSYNIKIEDISSSTSVATKSYKAMNQSRNSRNITENLSFYILEKKFL